MDLLTIEQRLQDYYARDWPATQPAFHAVVISQVENITTGWESELFTFVVEHGPGQARRQAAHVLRLHNGNEASGKARHEFTSIQGLARAGYPVPQVYVVETDATYLGKPFLIMERIAGQPMGTLMQGASPEQLSRVMTDFARLFVQLHTLDWHQFISAEQGTAPRDPYYFVDRWLTRARQRCQASPTIDFMPLVTWVADHRTGMACHQPAPTHQDFHPDNILIRSDGTPVVIDWTGFAITDARFDLAWTLLLADMHIGTPLRQQIHRCYEIASGQTVAALDCFLVTACFRRLIDMAVSLLTGPEQSGMRVEAVVAMKTHQPAYVRAYDLLVRLTGIRIVTLEELLLTTL